MNIQAIRFSCSKKGDGPENVVLTVGSDIDLLRIRKKEKCAAFVIRSSDLVHLLAFKTIVQDRGTKNKAKQLPILMLGYKKIPAITGNYRSSGQMARSVANLIDHAVSSGEDNIFLIGAGDSVFRELSDRISTRALRKGSLPAAGYPDRSFSSNQPDPFRVASETVMNLMSENEIPDILENRYLGHSIEVRLVKQFILMASRDESRVLIIGETGTGKEIVARMIHSLSRRQNRSFVAINCGAIPGELFESELFGHERGAFTGASRKKDGLWKTAEGGTLFLDEIGDLPLNHQVKILNSLQTGFIQPVGATYKIPVNTRIIAATNHDLIELVKKKQFRDDLYYRLRAIHIQTPALRDHVEDIPLIAQSLWKDVCRSDRARLSKAVTDSLKDYYWPGNVREMKMLLRQMRTIFGDTKVTVRHLESLRQLDQYNLIARKKNTTGRKINRSNVEYLLYLNRVEDILKSIRLSLKPIVSREVESEKERMWIALMVQSYLSDLEIVNSRPVDDKYKKTINAIAQLSRMLRAFMQILDDSSDRAVSYWKKDVSEELRDVLSRIETDNRRLIKN